MIRDLRAAPPRPPLSGPSSVAFSRDLVSRSGETASPDRNARRPGGFTIAVTAPRMLTCKRGLAAHLAAHVATNGVATNGVATNGVATNGVAAGAHEDGAMVCVVDADIESRDLGARFGVSGPVLLDVAKSVAVGHGRARIDELISRVDPPGLWVLPTRPPQSALLPMLRTKTASLLGSLRTGFDYVVVDAPVGLGVETPESDRAILQHVDALLVAVTADPSAIGGALRYLNALVVARNRNLLPPTFSIHLALTGGERDRAHALDGAQLDRKLQGLPVVAAVPQLWGRGRPDGPLELTHDGGALRDAFETIMHTVTTADR